MAHYYRLSTKAYQAKDFPEFLNLTTKLVKSNPANYRYRYNFACAFALNGDPENALKILQFLLDKNYDLALLAEPDADFETIRNEKDFQKNLDEIKLKPSRSTTVRLLSPFRKRI